MGWHRTSRQSRGYDRAWERLRVVILDRDNHLCHCPDCQRTGRIRPATEVDHIIPKAQGGTDDPTNLRAVHRECHALLTIAQRGYAPRPRYDRHGRRIKPGG